MSGIFLSSSPDSVWHCWYSTWQESIWKNASVLYNTSGILNLRMTLSQRLPYGVLARSTPPLWISQRIQQVLSAQHVNSSKFKRTKLTATADTANTDTKEDTVASSSSWPEAFLDDFESRIWMTYRSNFTPIPRNNTPEATSSMTLGVRLRSQLMDSQGFTSDTGWGCMIRSGQSLLANTLSMIQLGRGTSSHHHTTTTITTQKLVRVQC